MTLDEAQELYVQAMHDANLVNDGETVEDLCMEATILTGLS